MADDAERDAFYSVDEVVDGLGWSVGNSGGVPGADLVLPAVQCAAKLVGFGWQVGVLEVVAEAVDERECQVVVTVLVDAPDYFFDVPHGLHFAFRVACSKEPEELRSSTTVEAVVSFGEEPPAPIQPRWGLLRGVCKWAGRVYGLVVASRSP